MTLNKELRRRVELLRTYARSYGVKTIITSGVRTRKQQAELYAKRGSNPYPVSPPGCSTHEFGLAIDLVVSPPAGETQRSLSQLAPFFGLYSPSNDPIHFQVVSPAQFAVLTARCQQGIATGYTGISSFALTPQNAATVILGGPVFGGGGSFPADPTSTPLDYSKFWHPTEY